MMFDRPFLNEKFMATVDKKSTEIMGNKKTGPFVQCSFTIDETYRYSHIRKGQELVAWVPQEAIDQITLGGLQHFILASADLGTSKNPEPFLTATPC